MKRFTFSIVVTIVLGLAAYSLADAQNAGRRFHGFGDGPAGFFQERGGPGGPGRGFGGRRGGGLLFSLRGLELTDQQRAEIRAILEAERGSRQGPAADAQLQRELTAAIYADSPDAAQIAALQQKVVQAQSARLARRIEIEQKVAQVLTAEQRAQIRERPARKPAPAAR